MIDNNRILNENTLIRLDIDKEVLSRGEENNATTFQSHTLIIKTAEFKEGIDIDSLKKGLYSELSSIKISNKEVELKFTHTAFDDIFSIKQVYKEIEYEVNNISSVLDKFSIKDYRLICELTTIEF